MAPLLPATSAFDAPDPQTGRFCGNHEDRFKSTPQLSHPENRDRPGRRSARYQQTPPCHRGTVRLALRPVSKQSEPCGILAGECADSNVCPLSQIKAGTVVCIKKLLAEPAMRDRLREMGLGEEQKIKLVSHNSNFICQVCNARLGISKQLADAILVAPVSKQTQAA